MPNPEGIVDGKYLAWVTYPGADGMSPQNVGYLDMQTCKVTKLFSGRQYENIVGPVVSNGYFFWSRGTIHMTNMATGKTRDLSLPLSPMMQVVWPYLFYDRYDSQKGYIHHLYNVETSKDTTLISPTPVSSDFQIVPMLAAGPTIYWTGNSLNI